MTVVVEDGAGDSIPVLLQQDGANIDGGEVCGSTTEPIAIQPGLDIDAFVGSPEICPALAQGGVIKFTFLKG